MEKARKRSNTNWYSIKGSDPNFKISRFFPPMYEPDRSLFSLISYLFYLGFSVPIKRLLSTEKIVHGWSIRTEIAVLYLRRMLDNNLKTSRLNEQKLASIVNYLTTLQLEHVTKVGFQGKFIGPPVAENEPIIFYLHGGGYSLCDCLTYCASLSELMKILKRFGTNSRVFSLEYSLAPEFKYPTQLNEAIEALKYLKNICPMNPIYLMGDSAGGNLALALALELQNIKELKNSLAGCVLISPWTQMAKITKNNNEQSDFISVKQLVDHVDRFLPKGIPPSDPRVSPGLSKNLKVLPRTFVHYGGREFFKDDIEQFIQNAKDQKVDLKSMNEIDAPHITPLLLPFFPSYAQLGLEAIAKFIRKQ